MTKYIRESDLETQDFENKKIIFDTESFKFFELNETMSTIWNLLSEEKDQEEIINEMHQNFDAKKETIEKDVKKALKSLLEKDLIKKYE